MMQYLYPNSPFVPNAPFLYPLTTCFERVEKGCIGNKWVNTEKGAKSATELHSERIDLLEDSQAEYYGEVFFK